MAILASSSVAAFEKSAVSITDSRFGAIPNDSIDDTKQIQAAIDYAIKNKLSVYIPSGTFNVSKTLDLTQGQWDQNSLIKVYGESRYHSVLEMSSANTSLLKVAHDVEVSDLNLRQTASYRTGNAIDIPFASYRSNFSRLRISGFDNAIYGKWVVWSRFKDLFILNNNTGIYLHGNGEQPAYWNTEPDGWFNNVNILDNVYVEDSNVGIKIAGMGTQIVNSTVQNSNVGVEVYGPAAHRTWNNQISNFYAEGVSTVFKVKNSRSLDINGVFAQGGPKDKVKRKYAVIDADNGGRISIQNMTGQDWWNYSVVLKNTYVSGRVTAIGGTALLDNSSTYDEGSITLDANANADKKWVAVSPAFKLQKNSSYKVTISAIRDGYDPVLETYSIYNWNGETRYSRVNHEAGRGIIKFLVEGGQLYYKLDYHGGNGLSHGKLTIDRIH